MCQCGDLDLIYIKWCGLSQFDGLSDREIEICHNTHRTTALAYYTVLLDYKFRKIIKILFTADSTCYISSIKA